MLHLGTVSGKPSNERCVSLVLVFHFCSFSKHKTNHSIFSTCGFVHTFSWLFFLTAIFYNFIIFLCNNIFIVKWQGGTQADLVHVLPKKIKVIMIMMKVIIIIVIIIITIMMMMMMIN